MNKSNSFCRRTNSQHNIKLDTSDVGIVAAPITIGSYGTGKATISSGLTEGQKVIFRKWTIWGPYCQKIKIFDI